MKKKLERKKNIMRMTLRSKYIHVAIVIPRKLKLKVEDKRGKEGIFTNKEHRKVDKVTAKELIETIKLTKRVFAKKLPLKLLNKFS